MHIESVLKQLRTMRLSVMADSLERRIANGEHNGLSAEEFLALLIDDEHAARQQRKLARMIGRANFKPEQACIENVSYDMGRGFTKKDILQFTTPTWVQQAHNVVLVGPTGAGKTYIAEAIGLQACKMGYPARKIRYKMLFEEINNARACGQLLKYLRQIQQTSVLIIDDFLMAKVSTEDVSYLLEMIEERSQLGPLIVTTQYPVAKWHQLMPDPTIADAICDRVAHSSVILNLKGDSMRKRKTQSQPK
ncbi:MAG: AAA family ATPase [Chitinivibrionales bacterium]|nr:AAA family ATPase [Chitinivibrionales bacterium]MBD3395760.1 AAA family ATPase [Chitinivibrionales bacterium]